MDTTLMLKNAPPAKIYNHVTRIHLTQTMDGERRKIGVSIFVGDILVDYTIVGSVSLIEVDCSLVRVHPTDPNKTVFEFNTEDVSLRIQPDQVIIYKFYQE